MEPISSAFETLAEIAGALLGFAALAFSLAGRPEEVEASDKIRLWLLLSIAVGAIIGGVLPEVIALRGIEGPRMWTIWSGCFLGGAVQILGMSLVFLVRMTPEERQIYFGKTPLHRAVFHIQNVILGSILVSQVMNFAGIGLQGEQWICLVALLAGVVQAASILLMIVFLRPTRPV